MIKDTCISIQYRVFGDRKAEYSSLVIEIIPSFNHKENHEKKTLNFQVTVNFLACFRLTDLQQNKKFTKGVHGVYFLVNSTRSPLRNDFYKFPKEIVYIGKARKGDVHARIINHVKTIENKKTLSTTEVTRPGVAFKIYREKVNKSIKNHWVIVFKVIPEDLYLISCVEEFFIQKYFEVNGVLPEANSSR